MAMKSKELSNEIEHALDELEAVADEIRVKLHLANMDAKDLWNDTLAPKLEQTRAHAREASKASRKVIDDTIQTFRAFSASL